MDLNEKHLCYFTEEALEALAILKGMGLEKDLAVAVLEVVWKEEQIYALPDGEDCCATD